MLYDIEIPDDEKQFLNRYEDIINHIVKQNIETDLAYNYNNCSNENILFRTLSVKTFTSQHNHHIFLFTVDKYRTIYYYIENKPKIIISNIEADVPVIFKITGLGFNDDIFTLPLEYNNCVFNKCNSSFIPNNDFIKFTNCIFNKNG